ncbi:hypothetical protein Bca52824_093966 [Brassica carinata]|uniref:Uncharacterized protein n=1 Tax=Brassica carinata TaxID=52824 RepID=A0A8X7P578_BRACI|nr:hypothetical protein Bca52824_093966 [Brassica carinata]
MGEEATTEGEGISGGGKWHGSAEIHSPRSRQNLFGSRSSSFNRDLCSLIYKLIKEKTCAGLSLKSQDFLGIVEPFTAHYVFALGVARFLSCAHWVLQVLDTRGRLLVALGYGLWPSMVLISEIVQTFILADFCYYSVKSVFGEQLVLRLPSGVV